MKRIRKNQTLSYGETVYFDTYADGSLTQVEGEVQCDDGENVSIRYTDPLYPEKGPILKCLNKRQLYK